MNEALQKLINRMTSNYRGKKDGGNIHKLMQLTAASIQENEDALLKIGEWRDVDKAEGVVLDRIGGNVQQLRGTLPDETYRVLIKAKIKRTLSDGSIDTLIDFLSFLLQIPVEDVRIKELWQEGSPATLHVNVPGGSIAATGLTTAQFGQLLSSIVIIGVKVEALFEGTFSFSSNYLTSEMDAAAGFSDDAGTTGGTLGYSYSQTESEPLPI